jgi:hypothetical protein
MTYDLRRLRLHGLIEPTPETHRYTVTSFGLQVAMSPVASGLSQICDPVPGNTPLRRQFDRLEDVVSNMIAEVGLAA